MGVGEELPVGYSRPAARTGKYASRLEAEWARTLAEWRLPAEYCGDRVPHFDFLVVVGGLALPLECKPRVHAEESRENLVDAAVRRFHWQARANRVYHFASKPGRVARDKLLVVEGPPAEARWWFALRFAPGAYHVVRVGNPCSVLGTRTRYPALKWPVAGGEYFVENPLPFWVSQAHAGLGGEAGDEERQGRLF
ncbi:MAG: hypothetical protein PHU85_00220 [Phycisphaerae bacterium]|nr:hypothetical protein [Phycisphaerae bacterium]